MSRLADQDRYGNPMTIKLTGAVEPYFKDQKSGPPAKAEPAQKSETAKAGAPPAKAEKSATAGKSPKAKSAKPETKKKKVAWLTRKPVRAGQCRGNPGELRRTQHAASMQCLAPADDAELNFPDQRRPIDLGLGKFLLRFLRGNTI